jgi:hypothetical protein
MYLQIDALPTLREYFELRGFAMSGLPLRFAARDDVLKPAHLASTHPHRSQCRPNAATTGNGEPETD